MRRDTINELLKHAYTPEETAAKSFELAQSYQRLFKAKEEKAAAGAQFAERIKREEAILGSTSREIAQGWEMRQIPCKIRYNVPNTGIKSIFRTDTEELIKTLSMDNDELQDTLFEDVATAEDPDAATERNISNYFGIKPAADKPEDPLEITAWRAGEWVVAAASAEFAAMWMDEKGHKHDASFEWLDPDTIITVPETFYGQPSMTARSAIAFLIEQSVSFPILLSIPSGYLEQIHKGKNPETEAPESPQDEPKAPAASETSAE